MTTSTSFPIGEFKMPDSLTPNQREEYIKTIQEFPESLAAEVAGISVGELLKTYREGGWNVRQIVHHCADSHMNAFIRFRLALSEEKPTIKGYNQDAWANMADVTETDISASLSVLSGLHARWAKLLSSLSEAQFQRTYFHPEGPRTWTLDQALAQYDWHCRHHLGHVKVALGK